MNDATIYNHPSAPMQIRNWLRVVKICAANLVIRRIQEADYSQSAKYQKVLSPHSFHRQGESCIYNKVSLA